MQQTATTGGYRDRERFADNLCKGLPRIPRVKTSADFWAFSQAGRKLADLNLNYETIEPYPLKVESAGKKLIDADYRVEKMRYGKKGKDKDLTTLHYNDRITLTDTPVGAYDYVVNSKPALDWVVERQCAKTDKDSGIVNDANDRAVETMGNPRYPLELFQRVVTVSPKTMTIIMSLPMLEMSTPVTRQRRSDQSLLLCRPRKHGLFNRSISLTSSAKFGPRLHSSRRTPSASAISTLSSCPSFVR